MNLPFKKIFPFVIILSVVIFYTCNNKTKHVNDASLDNEVKKTYALNKILESGKITAITDYNSTSYFIYKGQPMGFHYDLLKEFADHLGVDLEIGVSNNLEKTFSCLTGQGCDLIALDLTVTSERSEMFDFTIPFTQSRQVLIQRKPEGWKKMHKKELDSKLIRNQLKLADKKIYVQKNSSFKERILNLSNEIGQPIEIVEPDDVSTEQLISWVANGDIDYTVADEHVALINSTYYENIDVSTAISFPQNMAWAVNKGSEGLLEEINNWMSEFKNSKKFKAIYRKYFKNPKYVQIVESEFYSVTSGKISPYDDIIKKHAESIDWDWRLLASLIYQESRFHPEVTSWAGAFGLMQLMPVTASKFGADSTSNPDTQIMAGVGFIKYLDQKLMAQVPDKDERIKFILASYNAGLGHILDAIRLADKYGKKPEIWYGNVDTFLLLKSNPKYYKDPVVKNGYSRGEESYKFVKEIEDRYELYKTVIK